MNNPSSLCRNNNFIKLSRECDGVLIPSGEPLKLKKGTPVKITQSLGGYFTLYVNGNLVKLDGKFADAIGEKIDSVVISFDSKNNIINLSIKQKEINEEKEALSQYGSSDSGASLGDILVKVLKKKK